MKDTGGSAFGEMRQVGDVKISAGGLTVRDYFASEALKVTLKSESFIQGDSSLAIDVARAYRVADMMMAEREK